jgi:hypothetical protein
MLLTRYNTAEPFVVCDIEGDALVTCQRRDGDVRVAIAGGGYGSTGGTAWIHPDEAARLSMWFLQAAIDARNCFVLDEAGHIVDPVHEDDDDDDDDDDIEDLQHTVDAADWLTYLRRLQSDGLDFDAAIAKANAAFPDSEVSR